MPSVTIMASKSAPLCGALAPAAVRFLRDSPRLKYIGPWIFLALQHLRLLGTDAFYIGDDGATEDELDALAQLDDVLTLTLLTEKSRPFMKNLLPVSLRCGPMRPKRSCAPK